MAPGVSRAELRSPVPNHAYTGDAANKSDRIDGDGSYKYFTYQHKGNVAGDSFSNFDLTVTYMGFEFGGALDHDVTLSNGKIRLSAPQTGSNYPAGVYVRAGATGIHLVNMDIAGFTMNQAAGVYPEGDDAVCDASASEIWFTGGSYTDAHDGNIDTKCLTHFQGTVTVARGHRNIRIWGKVVECDTINSADPNDSHIWLGSTKNGPATGTCDKLIASGSNGKPVFNYADQTPVFGVKACEYHFTVPTKVFGGKPPADVATRYGPSCQPDAQGYAINYVAPVVAPPPVVVPPVVVKSAVTVCSKTALKNGNGDAAIKITTTKTWKGLGLSGPATVLAAYQTTPACPFLYTVKQ